MNYEAILRRASTLADEAELYVQSVRSIIVRLERGFVKTASTTEDSGASVRCFKSKALGTAYTSTLTKESLNEAVKAASKLASSSVPEPDFGSLPRRTKSKGKSLRNYSRKTAYLTVDQVARMFLESAKLASSFSKEIYSVSGAVGVEVSSERILNTHGLEASRRTTSVVASMEAVAKREEDQATGFEYFDSSSIDDIDFEKLGTNSAHQAVDLLGSSNMESAEMPLVIDALAANIILGSIADAVNGENVVSKRTWLLGRKGEEVGSGLLTVYDDPLVFGRPSSSSFDDEGASSRKNTVLSKGVLQSWLHNTYSSSKAKEPNTGNAVRSNYRDSVSVAPKNLILQPGSGSAGEFIKDIRRGVYLLYTFDRPNEATGDLSALVMAGFKIQNGEISHPLKDTLVGINMIDLLTRIRAVGSDVRALGRTQCPSLLVERVKVSSGG